MMCVIRKTANVREQIVKPTIRMNSVKKITNLTILNRTSLELSHVYKIKNLNSLFVTAKRNFNERVMTSAAQNFHRQLVHKTYRDQLLRL